MVATQFAVAFLGGLIPALFWLWFWLKEDRAKPEPYILIGLAFLGGVIAVPIALPLQKIAFSLYQEADYMLAWVMIEEILKYGLALLIILWNKAVDEPIDIVIYMIAIALGFSAIENALFILDASSGSGVAEGIITGNLRFLGATLLHVLASGTVGVFLAMSFYKSRLAKIIYGMVGLFLAIVLHERFNFFIMNGNGETILGVFLFVWMGALVLILAFEKIKLLEARHLAKLTSKL